MLFSLSFHLTLSWKKMLFIPFIKHGRLRHARIYSDWKQCDRRRKNVHRKLTTVCHMLCATHSHHSQSIYYIKDLSHKTSSIFSSVFIICALALAHSLAFTIRRRITAGTVFFFCTLLNAYFHFSLFIFLFEHCACVCVFLCVLVFVTGSSHHRSTLVLSMLFLALLTKYMYLSDYDDGVVVYGEKEHCTAINSVQVFWINCIHKSIS